MGEQGQADPEVFNAASASLPVVRTVARGVPQVSIVPNLFSETGVGRDDPGRAKGELVIQVLSGELFARGGNGEMLNVG